MKYSVLFILSLFVLHSFSQNELIPFKVKDKWGASTTNGKLVIDAKYDKLLPFFHNVTKVELNEKYGVIDSKQKEIIPIIYDEVTQIVYSKTRGFSYVCEKDGKKMLQIGSEIIVPLKDGYDNISIVIDSNHIDSYYILSKKKGIVLWYDVIDANGKKIVDKIIADGLKINPVTKTKNINVYVPNINYTSKQKPKSYWWSESPEIINWEAIKMDMFEDFSRYEEINIDEMGFTMEFYQVDDFKDCFIYAKKQQTRSQSSWAHYTLDGKKVFGYEDKVEKLIYLSENKVLTKTYDDELNCKKPTKYGIYNLKTKAFEIEPLYYFYKKIPLKVPHLRDVDQLKMMEKMCEHLDEMKEMKKNGATDKFIEYKMMKMFGITNKKPEKIIVLASEDNLKIVNDKGEVLHDIIIEEGVFVADEFIAVNNKDSIYVGIEMFNDNFRGKGIMHVNTKDIVVKPIYDELQFNYNKSIVLSGEEIKTEYIVNFNFPINDNTSKIAKGFVKALSSNIYVVTKNDEDVAIHNVSDKKTITKYKFFVEEDYPRVRTINKKEYVFLLDKKGKYSVIDEKGKVLVPASEEEIEVKDIYRNKKYYFVTSEGYYGLDGKKYFK